jgi:Na+-transporting NADH:ubiquinone oxidoreductase subunit NqrB
MSSPAKTRQPTAPLVFTGNRLRDGRVAWLAPDGRWVEVLAEAQVFAPEEATEGQALAQRGERQQIVVGTYGVEVRLVGGLPVPMKFREQLRVSGPSVAAEPAEYRLAS